jgi:glycosyltransferase involved in cell wall biosynthesis
MRNGADLEFINSVRPLDHDVVNNHDKVWSCASSWRPHKRLNDNIRYFLEHSGENDCLIVAGEVENPVAQDRVYYVGNLDIYTLISLYKKSDYFIHLAFLDHCPNVVVDAAACGCKIICSSSGGTKEVAIGATLIEEDEWNFKPLKLYDPPELDFTKKVENKHNTNIDMSYVAMQYGKFLGG